MIPYVPGLALAPKVIYGQFYLPDKCLYKQELNALEWYYKQGKKKIKNCIVKAGYEWPYSNLPIGRPERDSWPLRLYKRFSWWNKQP